MMDDTFVVHIPKKKMWKKINDLLIKMGYNWEGASAREYWYVSGDKSCIRIDHINKILFCAMLDHYKMFGYYIFSTKDFMRMYYRFHGYFGWFRFLIIRQKLKWRK